jgi:hypothetical protein
MALAADGRGRDVEALIRAQDDHAEDHDDTFARVWAAAGRNIALGVEAIRADRPGQAVDYLLPVRDHIIQLGGSHAQRDLFARMLLMAALADGRVDLARALVSERRARRPDERFAQECLTKLDA